MFSVFEGLLPPQVCGGWDGLTVIAAMYTRPYNQFGRKVPYKAHCTVDYTSIVIANAIKATTGRERVDCKWIGVECNLHDMQNCGEESVNI